MTLRQQLLLLALSVLVLPWAAWQALTQMEGLLRQGQQQALDASAQAVARSLALRPGLLPPASPALPLHALQQAPRLDGESSDWRSAVAPLDTDTAAAGLHFALGVYNDRRYLFVEASDRTPQRGESHWPADVAIDSLLIDLDTSMGPMSLRVAGRADGPTSVTDARAAPLPVRLDAAWKNTAAGFSVELALPQGVVVNRLQILQRNADLQAVVAERRTATWAVYRPSARLPRELAALLPEDVRGRVVDVRGWAIAGEGSLRRDATRDEVVSWRRWLYRALLNAADIGPVLEPSNSLRDDSPERIAASAGQGGAEWRRDPEGTQLILTTAVPISLDGKVRAVLLLERSNAEALLLADRAVVHLLGLTVLAFFASAGLAFLFATRLSGRIRRLRDAAEQALGRSGEVRRFPVSASRDEIGDLSRSFSRLLDEISAYTDYLRSLASKLSHELQTPLAIVRSSLDNLDLAAMPAEARPYLARARDGVERMGILVRTMSEATRIEHAIGAAEHERFDLARLIADVAEGYRPMLVPRTLLVEGNETPLLFDGAPDLIVQALDKLVDNARGFTPADGRIGIALRRTGREAFIEVSNTGPALPEAMRHRLFDSLVSLRERARSADGAVHLGFGLHVVKLVAGAHGGTAEAENLADSSGVLFRLRFPLR